MEYTEGICQDGAAILCAGEQITIAEILKRLNSLADLKAENERLRARIDTINKSRRELRLNCEGLGRMLADKDKVIVDLANELAELELIASDMTRQIERSVSEIIEQAYQRSTGTRPDGGGDAGEPPALPGGTRNGGG